MESIYETAENGGLYDEATLHAPIKCGDNEYANPYALIETLLSAIAPPTIRRERIQRQSCHPYPS